VLETVKARIQTDVKIYIHNDLSQGATYFHEVIEEKLRKGDREGRLRRQGMRADDCLCVYRLKGHSVDLRAFPSWRRFP
jgi:hypothetical protein